MGASLGALYNDADEGKSVIEILLMHHLGMNRIQLYSGAPNSIDESVMDRINSDFERLLLNEPIQYVTGKAWFAGMELFVEEGTLIPRPETEELVSWVVSEYSEFQNNIEIVDVGTGSGCIALALKKAMPDAVVVGVDFSEKALRIAYKNTKALNLDVDFVKCDILAENLPIPVRDRRIIVSNPPYVLESEKVSIADRVRLFEPESALFVPDDDPLLFYRRILEIKNIESFFFEINPLKSFDIVDSATHFHMKTEVRKDIFGKLRMLKIY